MIHDLNHQTPEVFTFSRSKCYSCSMKVSSSLISRLYDIYSLKQSKVNLLGRKLSDIRITSRDKAGCFKFDVSSKSLGYALPGVSCGCKGSGINPTIRVQAGITLVTFPSQISCTACAKLCVCKIYTQGRQRKKCYLELFLLQISIYEKIF